MANYCSPTCIVEFADGEVTRMTTWSADGKPDLGRGIKLARFAYESRTMSRPPAIVALHFEHGASAITPNFTAEQIAEATDDPR